MYQELSYLLIVSGLLNIINAILAQISRKKKLQVLTLPLTALYYHISIWIFEICMVFDGLLQ